MRGEFGVVGDVIAVREEHEIDAAHFLDAFREGIVETRRIDEDVSALLLGPHDQVRPGAEARFRCEAAEINIVYHMHRKRFDAGAGAAARDGPDGSSRAGHQRHECAVKLAGILRLMVNAGFAAVIAKAAWSDLAAGVAIDATRVHEEFAGRVLREPLFDLRHGFLDSARHPKPRILGGFRKSKGQMIHGRTSAANPRARPII